MMLDLWHIMVMLKCLAARSSIVGTKISIYLRAPLNPGKVRVFCALVPSLVVEAWILVGYVWNLVGEVQNLVALQTVW